MGDRGQQNFVWRNLSTILSTFSSVYQFVGNLFSQKVRGKEGSKDEDVTSSGDAGQPERVKDVGHGTASPSSTGKDNHNDYQALKKKHWNTVNLVQQI